MYSGPRQFSLCVFLLLVSFAALTQSQPLQAQGFPGAFRTTELSAFTAFNTTKDGYAPGTDHGTAFGLDFSRFTPAFISSSLEFRANVVDGTRLNEHTWLSGVRLQTMPNSRIHPYINFLVGPGQIHFNHTTGYIGDNSTVYSYGGGLDIDLRSHFQLKADFQQQHWRIGVEKAFSPTLVVVGVAYRIPFRPHIRQEDFVR